VSFAFAPLAPPNKDAFQKSMESSVFAFAPLASLVQLPSNRYVRITVGGLRTRSEGAAVAPLFFATAVTEQRVWRRERIATERRKPHVMCCAGFCTQSKSLMGKPYVF
jgi:hypothetical protein